MEFLLKLIEFCLRGACLWWLKWKTYCLIFSRLFSSTSRFVDAFLFLLYYFLLKVDLYFSILIIIYMASKSVLGALQTCRKTCVGPQELTVKTGETEPNRTEQKDACTIKKFLLSFPFIVFFSWRLFAFLEEVAPYWEPLFCSWLCYWPAMWRWANHITSLCLFPLPPLVWPVSVVC